MKKYLFGRTYSIFDATVISFMSSFVTALDTNIFAKLLIFIIVVGIAALISHFAYPEDKK